jgi:hypothetical protein
MFFDLVEDAFAVWYLTWWVMADPHAPIAEESR